MLDVLAAADRERALVMVHAENHEMIKWITKRLLERGHGAPKFHMTSAPPDRGSRGDEPRGVALAAARRAGADRARVGRRGGAARSAPRRRSARASSPRPARSTSSSRRRTPTSRASKARSGAAARRRATRLRRKRCGRASRTAPSRCSPPTTRRIASTSRASCPRASRPRSRRWRTACPGLQVRLPLLFSEGVGKKRITLQEFVALTATNHAQDVRPAIRARARSRWARMPISRSGSPRNG